MTDLDRWAELVPELTCSDLAASTAFYCDILGFQVLYRREGFAYLELGGAQLMLEAETGAWTTGERRHPFGRGINIQIMVDDIAALAARLAAAGVTLFRDTAANWYRANDIERGQIELLVQDLDGYLLRFAQSLGTRPAIRP